VIALPRDRLITFGFAQFLQNYSIGPKHAHEKIDFDLFFKQSLVYAVNLRA
jgi:hypothetical protein